MPPQRTPLKELFGPHAPNQPYSPHQRGILLACAALGQKPAWFRKELGVPKSSLQSTQQLALLRNDGRSQLRSGRPKLLSYGDKRHILRIVRKEPKITYKEVREQTGVVCHDRTITRLLDTKPKLPDDTPDLPPKECRRNIIWSDECSAERGAGKKREWCFRTPGQKWERPMIQTYAKGKDVSVMVWAAFSGKRGRSKLHVMVRDLEAKKGGGGYSTNSYLEVLEKNIPTVWRRGMLVMQDNASIHTAIKVRNWFKEKRITVIRWPAYSPDLNPIEHIWFHLKANVLELYPELNKAPRGKDTIKEKLGKALEEAWEQLPQSLFDSVLGTMKRRCEAVIAAEGWHNKY
ncbi:transposase-like protein [Macrophomina phaseolina MS6]|uniref:Transposase-like protein n=1 Tax=Macrophomina phaseolina (strain MS6) TaxID=1126212 RepID=K2R8D4_MACPH|nr:transposase-like protein [Macrophomina phaseolina MS6]